jgi:RNA polymerase sigma factor (sigma-70 family)
MASHYRRERVHQPLEDIPERLISVEDEPSLIDEQELVERLLGVLNDNERTVVLMKYRDGKRNVSIADELGMNPSTVSTVLSRALSKMRDAYERSMRWHRPRPRSSTSAPQRSSAAPTTSTATCA